MPLACPPAVLSPPLFWKLPEGGLPMTVRILREIVLFFFSNFCSPSRIPSTRALFYLQWPVQPVRNRQMSLCPDFMPASLSLIQKNYNSPNWIWNETPFTDHGDSKYMHKWNQTSFLKQFVFTLAWNCLLKLENSLNLDSNSIASAWGIKYLNDSPEEKYVCKNASRKGDEVIISLSSSGQERSDWALSWSTWANSRWVKMESLQNTIILNSLHQEPLSLWLLLPPFILQMSSEWSSRWLSNVLGVLLSDRDLVKWYRHNL